MSPTLISAGACIPQSVAACRFARNEESQTIETIQNRDAAFQQCDVDAVVMQILHSLHTPWQTMALLPRQLNAQR
jgi:hypothetical protein